MTIIHLRRMGNNKNIELRGNPITRTTLFCFKPGPNNDQKWKLSKKKAKEPARKIWVFSSYSIYYWERCWCASEKRTVIGKRETFLFDFELLTAWNNLERDRIPAGLARDWGLKGVKLANSELHQSGTKYGLTSKSIATISISSSNQLVRVIVTWIRKRTF